VKVNPEVEGTFEANIQGVGENREFVIGKEYYLIISHSKYAYGLGADYIYKPPTNREPVEIMATVWAPGFDVYPASPQKLCYIRGEDSEPIVFKLNPTEIVTGQKIEVEFYYRQHWLAQIAFDANITKQN